MGVRTSRGDNEMNRQVNDNRFLEKRAEHHVFSKLLKRNLLPYRTAGGSLGVKTPTGRYLELRVASSIGNGPGEERRFAVAEFKPRPELFLLCVEFDEDEIVGVWVLPSTVFLAYSDASKERGLRELNLDAKQERYFDENFREYNSFFRNRWEPVTQFDRFQRLMKPWNASDFADGWENFEDAMMMLEADENWEPDEESITYEQHAAELAPALSD